ncbi:MAG: creatininase family protein [Armatimonadota bacterium]|nr:creatininase family protein [Armatimonadota bacterium]
MTEKVLYIELTPKEFLERLEKAPIAYLPLGTLEWHGAHLPLGSDGIQSQGFMVELAKKVGGIVLPMLYLGPDRYKVVDGKELFGMDICKSWAYEAYEDQQLPGSAYWVGENLFTQILDNTLSRLRRAGFRIIVAHGHGPSTNLFIRNIEKWSEQYGLKLFHCWREDESDGFGIQTDHAGANETSLVMALRPNLVQMENLDPDPNVFPLAIGRLDPRTTASPELGKKAIAMQLERMAGVLTQALAKLTTDGHR